MILLIMRHGQAVDYREPDHLRALTDFGTQQSEQVGLWLNENLPSFYDGNNQSANGNQETSIDVAIVSPYLRAQQTYRAVARGINVKQQVTFDAITPMGNAAQGADLIHGYASDINAPKSLLVVTHMPLVSLLSDKICVGFNAKIFDTADTLIVDYDINAGIGEQLAFYQG
jgi:phosphohistidine phosphatase